MKMSSDIIDVVEVNVVSSPEMSRPGSVDRHSLHSPQPPPTQIAVGSSADANADTHPSVGVFACHRVASHHSSSQNSTSVINNVHHPHAPHSYHPPPAHPLSNHHHHHSSNSAESNHSSPGSKTTTSSTTKCEPKKTTTTSSGYTSFSISSILSRNEPKKDVLFPSLPLLPLHHSPEDVHNSAMFSR